MKEAVRWTAIAGGIWAAMGISWSLGFISGFEMVWKEIPLDSLDLINGWRARDGFGAAASVGGVVAGLLLGSSNWVQKKVLGVELDEVPTKERHKIAEWARRGRNKYAKAMIVVGGGAAFGSGFLPYEAAAATIGTVVAIVGIILHHDRIDESSKLTAFAAGMVIAMTAYSGLIQGQSAEREQGRSVLVVGEGERRQETEYVHRWGEWILTREGEKRVWIRKSQVLKIESEGKEEVRGEPEA